MSRAITVYAVCVSDLVQNMDLSRELDKLQKQRALGGARHRKQARLWQAQLAISVVGTGVELLLVHGCSTLS